MTTDCTGPVVAGPDSSMIMPATAYGTTAYYAPTVTSSQTFKSNLQFFGSFFTNQTDCDNTYGTGNSVFVPPDACCWTFVGTSQLGNALTIDLSVFTPPFKVELQ